MDYIEVTAKTVSEAITKACLDLKLPSDRLDIKVISEGSKGFLGIGNKPAVIRVAEKAEDTLAEVEKSTEEKVAKAEEKAEKKEAVKVPAENIKKEAPLAEKTEVKAAEKDKKENVYSEKKERKESYKKPSYKGNTEKKHIEKKVPEKAEANEENHNIKEIVPVFKTEEEIAILEKNAERFLSEVFSAMSVDVKMSFNYVAQMACLEINFEGEEMGVLIGKRGQTLDSLQYLTSLVVNKTEKEYIRVKLDTEDYRRRRKETLENLAKNIAYKVRKTRKPVVLEAMNPFERRIIHAALQPNKYVETYSEGKEPYRHVVVAPKRNS